MANAAIKLFPLNPSCSRGYTGLGKLIAKRLLLPSDARTAFPTACPEGVVRKITCDVPARMRVEIAARALAEPIDSKCRATTSSGFIFSTTDDRDTEEQTIRSIAIRRLVAEFLARTVFIIRHGKRNSETSLRCLAASPLLHFLEQELEGKLNYAGRLSCLNDRLGRRWRHRCAAGRSKNARPDARRTG